MSPTTPVKIILGTHTVGSAVADPGIVHFDEEKDVQGLLDAFYSRGYRHIDTASNYPNSEARLGKAGATSRFTIHTKVHSGMPGEHEPSRIQQSITTSLKDLQTSSVETMFLHVPDRQTPFEDAARAMNDAWKEGKFKKFGLSNYAPEEVRQFVEICDRKGFVKPSVYQGHYNALVRGGEKELFPLLRENNIAFFAYSPAAGGIFAEPNAASARWKDDNLIGQLYSAAYGQPSVQASVSKVRDAAAKHGISGHAAAVRWTTYHSILDGKYGDGVIFAVSKMSQLQSTLDALEAGALPDELAEAMSDVYGTVGGVGPAYHL